MNPNMANFPQATRYIVDYIKLLGQSDPIIQADYRFQVNSDTGSVEVTFSSDELDDFEIALAGQHGTNYFCTIENRIKFRCLVGLGATGLLPDFEISPLFLNERGDWQKSFKAL
jgi:hypothetical protein